MILNALEGKALPVYGNGQQIRDWLYVEDHARALYKVVTDGKVGETYNIGGHNEKANIDVVKTLCSILEELVPNKPKNIKQYTDLITYVTDRRNCTICVMPLMQQKSKMTLAGFQKKLLKWVYAKR